MFWFIIKWLFKVFFFFQRLDYHWFKVWRWFLKFKFHNIITAWKVSKYGVFYRPYFPAFGLNTESIQSECEKIRTRKISYLDTSHTVNWIGVFQNLKSGMTWNILQFHQIWIQVWAQSQSQKLKTTWTKAYLKLGTEFIFLILHCSYIVGQYEYKNTLMLAFYSPYMKGCFFAPSKNRHSTYRLNILKKNNTEQCRRRNEKCIFYIHFAINFWIPEIPIFT